MIFLFENYKTLNNTMFERGTITIFYSSKGISRGLVNHLNNFLNLMPPEGITRTYVS